MPKKPFIRRHVEAYICFPIWDGIIFHMFQGLQPKKDSWAYLNPPLVLQPNIYFFDAVKRVLRYPMAKFHGDYMLTGDAVRG